MSISTRPKLGNLQCDGDVTVYKGVAGTGAGDFGYTTTVLVEEFGDEVGWLESEVEVGGLERGDETFVPAGPYLGMLDFRKRRVPSLRRSLLLRVGRECSVGLWSRRRLRRSGNAVEGYPRPSLFGYR
jgi:hypothetical protein